MDLNIIDTIGGGIAKGVSGIIDGAGKIVDRFVPNANEAAQAKAELAKLQESGDIQVALAQLQINLADAQSQDKFQKRWRPFLGWICGGSILLIVLTYVLQSVLGRPVLEVGPISGLILPVLGALAGIRTFEKYKGVT